MAVSSAMRHTWPPTCATSDSTGSSGFSSIPSDCRLCWVATSSIGSARSTTTAPGPCNWSDETDAGQVLFDVPKGRIRQVLRVVVPRNVGMSWKCGGGPPRASRKARHPAFNRTSSFGSTQNRSRAIFGVPENTREAQMRTTEVKQHDELAWNRLALSSLTGAWEGDDDALYDCLTTAATATPQLSPRPRPPSRGSRARPSAPPRQTACQSRRTPRR